MCASGNLSEGLAQSHKRERERRREQCAADHGEPRERLLDNVEVRAAKERGLAELAEVSGGRGGHGERVLEGAVPALAYQSAAPVRMMESIVTLSMISMSEPNHARANDRGLDATARPMKRSGHQLGQTKVS
ncbi:hypothetical protein [Paraburkholderia sp.]|uniref:hypothetical protein n=1 Tax=Paraburkholderia sp. TaxID=1926495 RepID=UPI0039C98A41